MVENKTTAPTPWGQTRSHPTAFLQIHSRITRKNSPNNLLLWHLYQTRHLIVKAFLADQAPSNEPFPIPIGPAPCSSVIFVFSLSKTPSRTLVFPPLFGHPATGFPP